MLKKLESGSSPTQFWCSSLLVHPSQKATNQKHNPDPFQPTTMLSEPSLLTDTPTIVHRNQSDTAGTSKARLANVARSVMQRNRTLGGNLTASGAGSHDIVNKMGAMENMTNPLETEAESMILKALDRQQEKNQNENAQNLLNAVPHDAFAIFRDNSEERPTSQNNVVMDQSQQTGISNTLAVRHKRDGSKWNKTIEQVLASLTDTLADIHQEIVDDTPHEKFDLVPDLPSAIPESASPGEQLAAAADLLYQGGRHVNEKPTLVDDKSSRMSAGSLRRRASTKDLGRQPSTRILQPSQGNQRIPEAIDIIDNRTEVVAGDPEVGIPDADASLGDGDGRKKKEGRWRNMFQRARTDVVQSSVIRDFNGFMGKRQSTLLGYAKMLFLVGLLAALVACILFYLGGNPPTGVLSRRFSSFANGTLVQEDLTPIDPEEASYSWWIIFIFIRQAIVFSLAHSVQILVVDFLCLGSRAFVRLFGSLVTLFIVQSRGWPFILVVWGSLNFGLLQGASRFAGHWLFWQSWLAVFNERNPSGTVLSNSWYTKIMIIAICVGGTVSVKRLWLGLYLGKKTYADHASSLASAMSKVVMLCEVAAHARRSVSKTRAVSKQVSNTQHARISSEDMRNLLETPGEDEEQLEGQPEPDTSAIPDLHHSESSGLQDLLGAWEDPALEDEVEAAEDVTISSILQFRQSLAILSSDFIFSIAWGDCGTRERMVASSREIYKQLVKGNSESGILSFSVLSNLCLGSDGSLDKEKAKEFIALLRPDRSGRLSEVDFVRSVDSVYKEVKLLRATVRNSEKIDQALEKMINLGFYIVLSFVVLGLLGFNPLTLFVSLSAPIVAFGFVLGGALSKMCEGWLFILIRRPYGIGDRIHVSAVDGDTSADGSPGWIVEDVTLFHTVVVFATTNERATIPNGSLAGNRVINMARSPNAIMYVHLRFGIDVPYERIQVFESSVREFVKSRPREWARFEAFRPVMIAADQGFVEYKIVMTHRESRQQASVILGSKAEVEVFCLELSKKLDIRYTSPALPVDLSLTQQDKESIDTLQMQGLQFSS